MQCLFSFHYSFNHYYLLYVSHFNFCLFVPSNVQISGSTDTEQLFISAMLHAATSKIYSYAVGTIIVLIIDGLK